MKMIIGGTSLFSEIAKSYFERSGAEVIGFIVEDGFLTNKYYLGKPVFEERDINIIQGLATHFYIAITYIKLNTVRTRLMDKLIHFGLKPASYISERSFIDPDAILGDHVFIFENNVVQYGCKIGQNTILWSGNHIGHHSIIGDNSFISSHCVISGSCNIGKNSFIGVNATLQNNVSVGEFCWLNPNVLVSKDISDNKIVSANIENYTNKVSSTRFFKVHDEQLSKS